MNTTSLMLKEDGQGQVNAPAERRDELLAEFVLCAAWNGEELGNRNCEPVTANPGQQFS